MVMMSFKLALSAGALCGYENNTTLALKRIVLNAMLNMTHLQP